MKHMITALLLAVAIVFLITQFYLPVTHAWFIDTAETQVAISSYWETSPENPTWDSDTIYLEGDYVIHNGGLYWARYWSGYHEPGTHEVWQEITDQWRWFNIYYLGDIVLYDDKTFQSRQSGNQNKVPGLLSSPWQELTDEWRSFNIYQTDDLVMYNGQLYRARWYTQNNRPDSAGVWELQ